MTFSLADLSSSVLTLIITYGPSMLSLTILLGAVGVPIPTTLLVLAAGAFVRQGVLAFSSALAWTLIGVVIGDSISYGMGRFARRPIVKRFGTSAAWQKAERNLQRRGGIAVYFTRWLLTPIAIPTNLVAGSAGYPYPRFLAYDFAGELTWLLLFGGMGYAFSSQWEAISQFISDFSGVLVGVLILGTGIYLIFRRQRNIAGVTKNA
jgi:membrane protein DedA with SNARE-associated domain